MKLVLNLRHLKVVGTFNFIWQGQQQKHFLPVLLEWNMEISVCVALKTCWANWSQEEKPNCSLPWFTSLLHLYSPHLRASCPFWVPVPGRVGFSSPHLPICSPARAPHLSSPCLLSTTSPALPGFSPLFSSFAQCKRYLFSSGEAVESVICFYNSLTNSFSARVFSWAVCCRSLSSAD